MMSKTKSVMAKGLKVFYVIPMVAAVLACNSRTETVYTDSEELRSIDGLRIKYACSEIETEAAKIPEKPKIVVSPTGVEVL